VKSPRLAIGSLDTAVIPVPGDVPTMGFGTTEGVKMGDRTTPVKAVQRALQDVSKYEGAVKKCVKVPLHQAEYDVYVDLAYNIGTGAFCGSTLVKLLNQEQYREACEQVLRWDKFKGQPLRGLTLRRQRDHAKCVAAQ
jgi:lysozyme